MGDNMSNKNHLISKNKLIVIFILFVVVMVSYHDKPIEQKSKIDTKQEDVYINPHQDYYDELEKVIVTKQDITNLQNNCSDKFKAYLKKAVSKLEKLEPVVSSWTVEFIFNFEYDSRSPLYQYSCLYTNRGELLNVVTVDENGINVTRTELQEKYNF